MSFFYIRYYYSTRGHDVKLYNSHCKRDTCRIFFFAERVTNKWNSLPPCENVSSSVSFKNTIRSSEGDFSGFFLAAQHS